MISAQTAKPYVVAGVIGIVVGCILGAWLVWQHDALVHFGAVSVVGLRGLLLPSVLGIALGWALVWSIESVTDQVGPSLWGPSLAGLIVLLGTCSVCSYLAQTNLSLNLLGTVLIVFGLPALVAIGIRIKIVS